MAFDFAGLKKITHPTFPGVYPTFGVFSDSNPDHEASWRTDERKRNWENSPEGEFQLAKLSAEQKQEDYQQQVREFKLKELAAAQKEQEEQAYRQKEKEWLLDSIADDTMEAKLRSGEIDSSILLESKAKAAAAEALKRGRQDLAKDFLNEASKYGKDADIARQKDYAMEEKRKSDIIENTIAAPPTNSFEYTQAVNNLLKSGIDVPDKFLRYSPEGMNWIKETGLQYKTVRDAEAMKAKAEAYDATEKLKQEKFDYQKQKDVDKAAGEARAREFQAQLKGASYKASDTELVGIISTYFKDGALKSLDKLTHLEVANQIAKEALTRYIGNEYQTLEEARSSVAKDYASRVVDGKLVAPTPTTSKTTEAKQPTSDLDKQAIEWANKNKNDPRAKQILDKFGL